MYVIVLFCLVTCTVNCAYIFNVQYVSLFIFPYFSVDRKPTGSSKQPANFKTKNLTELTKFISIDYMA